MRITIAGFGNIGTQFAAHCAEKGHIVTAYTSHPDDISKHITIVGETGETLHAGDIFQATNIAQTAFETADVIFITMPAYCMKDLAAKIFPYVHAGLIICIVPGTGGGECAFKECMEKGAVVCGIQRVPSVARLVEYGKTVRAIGYRDTLHCAALPSDHTEKCSDLISSIFDKPCVALPNYLCMTLTPSNPILHTTRLKALFGDYREGVVYDRVPLFYEEWSDETSVLLLKCDDEVQELCRSLDQFDLTNVRSLRLHYESPTAEAMTRKISSIDGFKGLTSPTRAVDGGFIPDLESRYFTADFPYGLSILVQIAELCGVDTPNMHETLEWYYDLCGNTAGFKFSDYGITDKKSFVDFYSK